METEVNPTLEHRHGQQAASLDCVRRPGRGLFVANGPSPEANGPYARESYARWPLGDRLRALWDFDDLDASEARFRAQLEQETTDAGRAEVLTQLARIEGLRGDFEKCDALLDEAESIGGAEARLLLERGRRERSSGRPGAGLAEFEQAFELARASGEDVLAVDAAHMIAIVDDSELWTARAVEIARPSSDPGVRYWLGPLYNNLGWSRLEAGDAAGALEVFELALASRERDDPRPYPRETARYAVGKALRAVGRPDEAAVALERCLAWAAEAGVEDEYFHEELAEDYAALGRDGDARDQARRALELIGDDPVRIARLRELAGD
jgi:tetratricopeptide (TPR) repeat protein